MIPSECEDGSYSADEVTEQNIETVVSEVGVASRGDVDACEEWDDCED